MPDSHPALVPEFPKFSIVPAKQSTGRNSEAADFNGRKYRLCAAEVLLRTTGVQTTITIVSGVSVFNLTIVNYRMDHFNTRYADESTRRRS